jgi:hypothetical protein
MDEKVKDFIPEKRVTTPTLGWWCDFLIPKIGEVQWAEIPPDTQRQLLNAAKKGAMSSQLLSRIPVPILNLLLEIVVYYVKQNAQWCKDNLDIADFLGIFNAFLKVCDSERVMHFFGEIAQQVPLVALAKAMKA